MTSTVESLAASVPDGATIGFGGAGLQRKPLAFARALLGRGARELRVIAFLGSLEVEILLAGGCIAELHSAGVALDGAGLAPRYRAARESGAPTFVEWSEGLLLCALQAAASGVPSQLAWMGVGTDVVARNPHLREGRDPFTGEPVVQVRALRPDVAVLHVPRVDDHGNAHVDGDLAADGLLARAAARTLVTAERVVAAPPHEAAIGRVWIDDVAVAPGGGAPGGCLPDYRADLGVVGRWAKHGATAGPELLDADAGAT